MHAPVVTIPVGRDGTSVGGDGIGGNIVVERDAAEDRVVDFDCRNVGGAGVGRGTLDESGNEGHCGQKDP